MARRFVDPGWASAARSFEEEKFQAVFLYLIEKGACYANEIAQDMGIDPDEVRRILDYMVENDLMLRSANEEVPRGIYYPTKKGMIVARNLSRLSYRV